jgi:peptidyl-prolyl cis-trans isomerase SurA
VPEFATAVTALQIGDISEPVRSEFGYHVVEVMDRRTSAVELADRLHEQLQDDPDAFAELAREQSEDITTAREGGDLGWVLHYQHDAARDQAIFDLTEVGEISEPVVTPNGIYIFKLLDTSESRYVLEAQRTSLGSTGFNRWLEELKDEALIWIDPELAPATTTA